MKRATEQDKGIAAPRRGWMTVAPPLGLAFLLAFPFVAMADSTAVIEGNAFGQATGNVQVNLAAGQNNEQSNAASIAIGGSSSAITHTNQYLRADGVSAGNDSATISGNAFSNASGLLSINEVSGSGNAEANSVTISLSALGGSALSSNSLSQVTASDKSAPVGNAPSHGTVAISGDAFANANGLIQINQVAGRSNATANQFALELNLSAHP